MAYSPELDRSVSAYVRRVAWALHQPMTVTLEALIRHVAERTDPEKVCPFCRDRSHCPECYLNRSAQHGEHQEVQAVPKQ